MKNLVKNLALMTAVLALFLFIFELVLRILPHEGYCDEPYLYKYHRQLGFILNPGVVRKTNFREFTYVSRINSKGLREDLEYEYKKPFDVYRMIFLGDSYTYACTDKENSFEDIFEKYYRRKYSDKIEVINISAPGYGTYHESVLLKEEGLKYHPDKVILFFFWNDVEDNILGKNLATVMFGHRIRTAGMERGLSFKIKTFLKIHLLSYRFLSEKFEALKERMKNSANKENKKEALPAYYKLMCGSFDDPRVREGWEKTKSLLSDMKSVLDKNNMEFEVVIIPTRYSIYQEDKIKREKELGCLMDPGISDNKLTVFLAQSGIAYYDLTDDLRRHSADFKESFYYPTDEHFNKLGNKITAELLIRHFEKSIKGKMPNYPSRNQ